MNAMRRITLKMEAVNYAKEILITVILVMLKNVYNVKMNSFLKRTDSAGNSTVLSMLMN